jgi:hypothetical protein
MTAVLDFVTAAEAGELGAEEYVAGVNAHRTTLARLQGTWQRIAAQLCLVDFDPETYSPQDCTCPECKGLQAGETR